VPGGSLVIATTARAAAAQIVGPSGGPDDPEAVAHALVQASGGLYGRVGRWVGMEACRTLGTRAWNDSVGRHPALARLAGPEPHQIDVAAVAEVGGRAAFDGYEAFVGCFIELLGRFVGLDVAIRMALPVQPDSSDPGEV
jgi:hypothetical protein